VWATTDDFEHLTEAVVPLLDLETGEEKGEVTINEAEELSKLCLKNATFSFWWTGKKYRVFRVMPGEPKLFYIKKVFLHYKLSSPFHVLL
jgi:hypothetical protein